MGKKKSPLFQDKIRHQTVEIYFSVVLNPSVNKNEEKPLKTEKEIVFLAVTNDKSNANSSITTTIRLEKATIMETNTVPANDYKKLDKNQNKNKEETENRGEEDEDGPHELKSKIKNNDNQESYFNNETEEATNMGADIEVTSVGVPLSGQNNVEGFDENVVEKLKSKSNKEQAEEGKL